MSTLGSADLSLSFPTLTPEGRSIGDLSTMDDSASDTGNESLADSSYDIVSEADSAFDDVSSTSVHSRADTPTHDSDDEEEADNDEGAAGAEPEPEPPETDVTIEKTQDNMDDPGETPRASTRFEQPAYTERMALCYELSPTKLKMDRPFRVIYHGELKHRDGVIEKIAQALSMSSSSTQPSTTDSEYSIVQLSSFGDQKASPEVTLVPCTGSQLVVDNCEFCSRTVRTDRSNDLTSGRHDWQQHQNDHYSGKRSANADLAIYVHLEGAHSRNSFRYSMGTQSAGVPTVDIADGFVGFWAIRWQRGTLRYCKSMPEEPYVETHSTPIDLDTFLALDAGLLNHQLAFMTQTYPERLSWLARKHFNSIGCWLEPCRRSAQGTCVRVTSKLGQRLEQYHCAAKDIYGRVTADPQNISKILMVSFILLISLLAGNFISNFLRGPMTIDTGVAKPPCTRSIGNSPTADVDRLPAHMGLQATWVTDTTTKVETHTALHSSTVRPMTASKGAEKEDAPTDPTVELVPVKGLLYHLKVPQESGPRALSIQPKVTASSSGRPVKVSTAKWNGTLFSLDFEPEDKSQVIDVFVGFEKSPRVFIFKIGPHSSWIDLARMQKLIDRQLIESGVAACLASTKELSQLGQRQLAVFKDHANVVVVGSKEWLQAQAKSIQETSTVTAVTVWQRLSARQAVLSAGLGKTSKHVTKDLQAYAQHLTRALSKNVVSLRAAKEQFTRRVQDNVAKARHDAAIRAAKIREDVARRHAENAGSMLSKARTRAAALRSKLKQKGQAKLESRSARKADRKANKAHCGGRKKKCGI